MSQDQTPDAGLPLALPAAPRWPDVSSQVSRAFLSSTGTNTPPVSPSSPLAGRVGARRLARLRDGLSERDWSLLRLVEGHRYLSARHAQCLAFRDHASPASAARTTRRVLARLERDGLLRRAERRIGGVRAGSSGTIWQLAPGGARLLRDGSGNYRTHEPSPRFLAHCLAVADVHLRLLELAETPVIDDVRVELEPQCWRRYSGPGGEARWLQPDLAATVATKTYVDHWFVEVDLGTESLPTLLRKCVAYEAYRASGLEQQRLGVFPLVLWVFSHQERGQRLQSALLRGSSYTPELHQIAATDDLQTVLMGDTS